MLKCIVVDDDVTGIDVLSSYIQKVQDLELVSSFRDPLEALAFLESETCDIAFLDINMPGINGLQLAKLVESKDISIIFCTAYSEFALESYEISAIDYLLKPVPMDRFLKAIAKIRKSRIKGNEIQNGNMKQDSERIFFKCSNKIQQVDISDLLYMKKDGHYLWITTKKETLFSRMSIPELLSALPDNGFIQVHRSFVVALDHIKEVEKHHLMVNNEEIPIGNTFRKELLEKIKYAGS